MNPPTPPGREHGDRAAFVARLRRRLDGGVPGPIAPPQPGRRGGSHPGPGPVPDPLPAARERPPDGLDDPDERVAAFVRAAAAVHTDVLDLRDDDRGGALAHLAERLASGAWPGAAPPASVVAGHGEGPAAVAAALARRGVAVEPLTVEGCARADVAVVAATAAVASTGSVVLDAPTLGARCAALLPPSLVCLVAADTLAATPDAVLRPLAGPLPGWLALVTGPSRSADIEQTLVEGVHGPHAVLAVLLAGGGPDAPGEPPPDPGGAPPATPSRPRP